MNKVLRKWVGIGVMVALSGGFCFWSQTILPKNLDDERRVISELKNQKSVLEAKGDLVQTEVVKEKTGVDKARMDSDIKAATELLKRALTWNNSKSYNEIRQSLMKEYHLSDSDGFMTTYLPEVKDMVDGEGTHYNYIDEFGLNARYEKGEFVLNEAKANKNEYFAFVTFSSKSKDGERGYAKSVFLFEVDQDGNLSKLRAYPMEVPELDL